jgi:hypothetical protein
MPEKPRVKAPKQRAAASREAGRDRRLLGIGAAAAGGLLGVVAVVALLGLGGGSRPSVEEVRASLQAAGCTLQVADGVPASHAIAQPGDTSDKWNTDPPTSGPHYGIAAIFGIYEEPVEQARIVHDLEHGGVFIQYGDDVPEAAVNQLRDFYNRHENGTLMAPYPRLGNEFALGAWVADGDEETGYLAKCKTYDEQAVSDFFEAFQFLGRERFDPSQLQPGM